MGFQNPVFAVDYIETALMGSFLQRKDKNLLCPLQVIDRVISQFPVSTWFDMFADNTYADACLTRITDKHHTYRLEMNGINMRETE